MSDYNSFYGGRRGASFIIAKSYKTIQEMVDAFSQGGDYKVVNYDEYVLIDTELKNDKDNGKVYRRGYDYNDEMGGAIYVGQIVGPSGPAPHVELKTVREVTDIIEEDELDYRRGEGKYIPEDLTIEGNYIDEQGLLHTKSTSLLGGIIPGKYMDEQGFIHYNDSISWAYCSIRDEYQAEGHAYIGFKFPYMVTEYTAKPVSPYYKRAGQTEDFNNTELIERVDDKTHPYYQKWHISIPKGVKGDSIKDFEVITANANVKSYPGQEDDILNGRKILAYKYTNYDKKEEGEEEYLYLGDYNMVKKVTILNTGDVKVDFTHDDSLLLKKDLFEDLRSSSAIAMTEDDPDLSTRLDELDINGVFLCVEGNIDEEVTIDNIKSNLRYNSNGTTTTITPTAGDKIVYYSTAELISVSPNADYEYFEKNNSSLYTVVYYDSNMNIISGIAVSDENKAFKVFTTPKNCYYINLTLGLNSALGTPENITLVTAGSK